MRLVGIIVHRLLAIMVVQICSRSELLRTALALVDYLLVHLMRLCVVLVLLLVVKSSPTLIACKAKCGTSHVDFVAIRFVVVERNLGDVFSQLINPFWNLWKLERCLRVHHPGVVVEWKVSRPHA